jgi:hypothetical protein
MDSNIPVTDEMIKIKARDYYGSVCNIDPNFKFSNGLEQNFNCVVAHHRNSTIESYWLNI